MRDRGVHLERKRSTEGGGAVGVSGMMLSQGMGVHRGRRLHRASATTLSGPSAQSCAWSQSKQKKNG